ncbi:MAG: F0F1 ATP synthase subunit delta [Rhodocyclaceae bacterium]|jgi:F-type H+-transporting ATPase subunit delta|nr:F0F1 ATP synthase subunit delta [Zoogloeaceae bacterium]MCQ3923465.1 F0F1 ATP synthase subunit delta [Rhodocyclaceae bacterium]MCZ2174755.1 F0F1 ATP synthase subunit delta [Burkholderiales bacterium]OQY72047.1 MAG: F0F1 ATP synthase subunit delta [Rhodocyclaceae bacterium UTPRO2]HNQ56428.1 F0F1 ATP synthase subunit delta [Candidatus Desulfobacillus denitrificans]
MAENITLARPYADAAFQLARATNALGPWQQALDRMAAVAADAQMVECITNPRLLPAQVAQLFLDVVGSVSAEQQNFVRLLVDNERLQVLPEIRELYVELKNGQEGVQEADIASAFPLDDATLKNLVADLEARFKCRIQAKVSLDPELIGGVRIAVGDQVIDASVRGKLASMATALQS